MKKIHKRTVLESFNWNEIVNGLSEIEEDCDSIRYMIDDDKDTLLNAFDDDEEEFYEFQMLFCDLAGKSYNLYSEISENSCQMGDYFDDCAIGLLGNRFRAVGFDSYEEDYYSLCSYDEKIAQTVSGKKIMKMTKQEMLSALSQCMGVIISYYDIKNLYDGLKTAIDTIKGKNTAILKVIKQIESEYENANDSDFRNCYRYDSLLSSIPEKFWIE